MEEKRSGLRKVAVPAITLAIGVVLGVAVESVQVAKLQSQIESAKKFFPSAPALGETRVVSGTIQAISGDTITLEERRSNPFEQGPTERTITVTPETKLVSIEQKDRETIQQERAEENAAIMSGEPVVPPSPPVLFTEKSITFRALTVGMMVSVEANENIQGKTSFTATKISVTPQVVAPPVVLP